MGFRRRRNGQAHVVGAFPSAPEQAKVLDPLVGSGLAPEQRRLLLALAFTARTAKEPSPVSPEAADFY